jgi:hypothetical protein
MVPRIGAEKAEGFTPYGQVHNLIYARQREWILRTRFVETGVVDAHPPFAALLFHQHGVGQPLGVVYLFDEARRKELLDLLPYGLAIVIVEMSQLLFDRLSTRFDVELIDRGGVPDLSVSGDKFDSAEVDPHDLNTTSKPEAPMQSLNQLPVVTNLVGARSS